MGRKINSKIDLKIYFGQVVQVVNNKKNNLPKINL